jgi:hypothetical protein
VNRCECTALKAPYTQLQRPGGTDIAVVDLLLNMAFQRGDHVCSLYSTTEELAHSAAEFLAEGLSKQERCWYVGVGEEMPLVQRELQRLGVDVRSELGRNALQLTAGSAAYIIHGSFSAEATLAVFNDAIEHAHREGFTGLRAAAEMSWILDCENGPSEAIVYEALLKSLFANCRSTGLCFYHRERMPLDVINGALETHPLAGVSGRYGLNPFYDPQTKQLSAIEGARVRTRLSQLERSGGRSA